MKKPVASITTPGQLTVLAALLAGLCAPAHAADTGTKIVISQVYGGGGNSGATYKNDFIELFNRSGETVSIGGWSVQYASATGGTSSSPWGVTAIPQGVSLEPGQYYLIREAAGTGGNTDVPYDLDGGAPGSSALALSATAGKVALVNNAVRLTSATPSGASLVDLVGFGTNANGFEGTGPTSAPSNTAAVLRKVAGCTDNNDNAADFATGAPTPRSSVASNTKACQGTSPVQAIKLKTSCPTNLSFIAGSGGSIVLKASDADSAITGASITSGGRSGVTLSFVGAAAGADASATLSADTSVAAGSFPVDVTFTNGTSAENAVCTVTISAGGKATIAEIQGTGPTSPLNNTVQTTEGVITKIVSNGYFIQDTVNGGPAGASRGLFVFGAAPAAAVGDLVRVTGTITEFVPVVNGRSYTEMKNADTVVVLSSGNTVTATNLSLPMADLTSYDSMLVSLSNTMMINSTDSLTTFGELTLGTTRHEVPTNRFPKGPDADALAAANAADTFVLSSPTGAKPTVSTIPYFDYNVGTRRVGDQVSNLVGVLDFGSIGGGKTAYKLQPVLEPQVSSSNARTAGPDLPIGNVRVASANVLNYFTTFTNGQDMNGNTGKVCTIGGSAPSASQCRGANNKAEFDRQSSKIVNELAALNADVVGLMEIQNNTDNALADVSVAYLVSQLNAKVGFGTYTYVGGAVKRGTDAIRVAMIYKPAVVTAVGAPMEDADPDNVNNRGPLAQTFKAANGAKFSVVVNHLKSKGGSCPTTGADADANDSQGCYNGTRIKQAQHLAGSFVPYVMSTSGDPDVLLIGDFNSHGFEDPINVLTAAGLVNELERFVRPNGMVYSYVFDAESGYLDHALATPGLNSQVLGATEWHNNADEPTFIDYNSGAFSSLYKDNAYRASDHDPVVVSLNLAPTFTDVGSKFSVLRSSLSAPRGSSTFSGTITLTNTSGAAVNGPLQVEIRDLPAGVTVSNPSGSHNGVPYITVPAASIAAGASVTVNLSLSNPSKGAMTYTTAVFSGTF